MYKLLAVLIVSLVFSGCDYYDYRLKVINKTNNVIAIETYLDTLPDFPNLNHAEYYFRNRLEPKDSIELVKSGKNGWLFFIEESRNKKLNLIVYNIDSLRKYESIDTLIKKRIYRCYEFSEKELQEKNWKIVIGK
jgi:hypothetical protein